MDFDLFFSSKWLRWYLDSLIWWNNISKLPRILPIKQRLYMENCSPARKSHTAYLPSMVYLLPKSPSDQFHKIIAFSESKFGIHLNFSFRKSTLKMVRNALLTTLKSSLAQANKLIASADIVGRQLLQIFIFPELIKCLWSFTRIKWWTRKHSEHSTLQVSHYIPKFSAEIAETEE